MSDVVALLLGDDMPPERLGQLLKAARKRRDWKRKRAAAAAGITPEKLRAYERGTAVIPAEVCARLADAYGEDLAAHVPVRYAPEIEPGADSGDMIATYIEMVRQLRRAKPGDALPLRAFDLAALALALETDADTLEQRIVEALGCTRAEARSLHRQLLQRKVVLPVAGLAAGLVAFAGMQVAHASPSPEPHAPPPAAAATTAAPGPVVAAPTTEITRAPATATTTTIAVASSTTVVPLARRRDVAPQDPPVTAATVASPTTMPRPVIAPDDTVPEGVLPGEVPYDPFK